MISRKTITFVVAILTAALVLVGKLFNVDFGMDPTQIALGIGAVLTYVFFEAKLDLSVLKKQPSKWKDPKFWLTVISVILTGIEQVFHLGIPITEIVSALTVIVGLLFGVKFKAGKSAY